MADFETVHKLVEKIEVKGTDKVAQQFATLTRPIKSLDKRMQAAVKSFKGLSGSPEEVKNKVQGLTTEVQDLSAQSKKMARELAFADVALEGNSKAAKKTRKGYRALNQRLSRVNKGLRTLKGALKDASVESKKVADPPPKQSLTKSFFKASLAADLAARAINWFRMQLARAWDFVVRVNFGFEAMQSRLQGLALAFTELGEKDPFKRVRKSALVSEAAIEEINMTAVRTATRAGEVEQAFSTILPALAPQKKSMHDMLKLTENLAAASKVVGDDLAVASGQVAKAIAIGQVDGEKGLALILRQEARVTAKMTPEERLKRISKVLAKVAAPVSEVTKDLASSLTKLTILSGTVLRKITYPFFKKVGDVLNDIVNYLTSSEERLTQWVVLGRKFLTDTYLIGKNAAQFVYYTGMALGHLTRMDERFRLLGKLAGFSWMLVKFIGRSLGVAAEYVRTLTDPGRGMDKFNFLAKRLNHTFLDIKLNVLEIAESVLKLLKIPKSLTEGKLFGDLPDWARSQIPGLKMLDQFQSGLKSLDRVRKGVREGITKTIDDMRVQREGMEKAISVGEKFFGMMQSTDYGINKEFRDFQKTLREQLKGIFGKGKALMNVEKVEIRQDFRDADPDRVLLEFQQALEGLGEAALQSSAGGLATTFGPGGTQ